MTGALRVRLETTTARLRIACLFWTVSALALACHRESVAEESGAPNSPRRVRCAPIDIRPLKAQVLLHGTVAPLPDRDAQIAPQVAGRILVVLVREGDPVARGQALARIDNAALADQVREAEAQLAKARAEADLARTTRARVERVFQRGIAARQELDDADARLATAQAGEAEVRAAVEIARRQLDRASVRSPLRGVVLKLFRKPGELVDGTPATPIVEVGDPEHLELVASATAAELVRVHARDSVTIEVPALPGSAFGGTVAAVSPAVDRTTGLGSVRITLEVGAGPRPPVGVTGVGRIQTGPAHAATLVPAAALRATSGDEGEIVICGTDHKAHVMRVRRGGSGGGGGGEEAGSGLTEVRALAAVADGAAPAVTAGTLVAVDPVLGIADGDPIEPAR